MKRSRKEAWAYATLCIAICLMVVYLISDDPPLILTILTLIAFIVSVYWQTRLLWGKDDRTEEEKIRNPRKY